MTRLPLVAAAGQAQARSGDPAANVETALLLLEEAAGHGARVLVLPEAFLTGYDERVFTAVDDLPAPHHLPGLLAPLARAARAAGTTVVLSTPLRRGAVTTMSAVVVHRDGSLAVPYDKQHLPDDEAGWFTPGDHGGAIVVDDHELGLAICYDTSVPEHARAARASGAQAYLASAAWFPGDEERRDTRLAARARDNALWVVAAGATGTTGGQAFVGGSGVWGPDGVARAQLGTEPGVVAVPLST